MTTTKAVTVRGKIGVVLPLKAARALKLRAGDAVTVVERPEGVLLTNWDEGALRQLETGRNAARRQRHVLTELAKL